MKNTFVSIVNLLPVVILCQFLNACNNIAEQASQVGNQSAPSVTDDTVETFRNLPQIIDILANDSTSDTLTLVDFSNGMLGTVSEYVDQGQLKLQYNPNQNAVGRDSFNYTVKGGNKLKATATVTVNISPWTKPAVLGRGDELDLNVSANGNAIAVWRDGSTLFADQFTWGVGWEEKKVLFSVLSSETVSSPKVRLNSRNQNIIVWKTVQSNGAVQLGSARILNTDVLTQMIDWPQASTEDLTRMNLLLKDDGTGRLLWNQQDLDGNTLLWEKRIVNVALSDFVSQTLGPLASVSGEHSVTRPLNEVLVWTEEAVSNLVWWRYMYSGFWSAAEPLATATALSSQDIHVSMNYHGRGVAAWTELTQDANLNVMVMPFNAVNAAVPTRGPVNIVSNGEGKASALDLAINDEEFIALAWQESTADGSSIWVYHLDSNKQPALDKINSNDALHPTLPKVFLYGNTITVIWWEDGRAVSRHYDGSWAAETALAIGSTDTASYQAGADALGNLLFMWKDENGDLWSANHCVTTSLCQEVVQEHQVKSDCVTCHDGVNQTGKSQTHLVTSELCDYCHITQAWSPATLFHSLLTEACETCHDDGIASGIYDNHFNSVVQSCAECHHSESWLPPTAYKHNSVNYPGDHRKQYNCNSCHMANIALGDTVWRDLRYIYTCAGCHSTDYRIQSHLSVALETNIDCARANCHRVTSVSF